MSGQDHPPLAGIRVVDLTHIIAGPFCTQFLADAGALVIKVEPPGGEYSRTRGPQRVGADGRALSSYSAAVNRGKHPLAIDLKNAAGRALFERMVATADVVVDNFAPTALDRMGISYDELRGRYPRLITASINLWGVDGRDELAGRGGVAVVAEAEAGLLHRSDGDGAPLGMGFAFGDTGGGLTAYAAIVTALLERDRTGRGRHISISLVRLLVSMNTPELAAAQRGAGAGPDHAGPAFVRRGDGWNVIDGRGRELAPMATARDLLADEDARRAGYLWDLPDGVGGEIAVPANPLGHAYGNGRIPTDREDADAILRAALGIHGAELEGLREAGAFGPGGRRG